MRGCQNHMPYIVHGLAAVLEQACHCPAMQDQCHRMRTQHDACLTDQLHHALAQVLSLVGGQKLTKAFSFLWCRQERCRSW